MTYSRLTLYRGRESYIVDDAKAIDVFFGLREDIEKLSLANYFCELAGEFSPCLLYTSKADEQDARTEEPDGCRKGGDQRDNNIEHYSCLLYTSRCV